MPLIPTVQAHTFESYISMEVLVATTLTPDNRPLRFEWQVKFTSKKLLHLLARYASARVAADGQTTTVEPRFRITGSDITMTRQEIVELAASYRADPRPKHTVVDTQPF